MCIPNFGALHYSERKGSFRPKDFGERVLLGRKISRPCSPIWDKWNGSSGQTPCSVPLVPRRSEDPLLLIPLVPVRSEDPLLLVPLVPHTPTCPDFSHLFVPLVLSQISFLRFFLDFSLPFHVSKNTFE